MREGREHRHRESVDVIERKHGGDAVFAAEAMLGADGMRVRGEIGVGEHHALGLAGGAGGVHQEGEGVGNGEIGPRAIAALRRPARRLILRRLIGQGLGVGVDLDDRDGPREILDQVNDFWGPLRRGEDERAVGMVEHVLHLLGLREQVHGIHAVATRHRAEKDAERRESVGHHERDVRAGRETVSGEQSRDVRAGIAKPTKGQRAAGLRGDEISGVGAGGGLGGDQRSYGVRFHLPQRLKYSPNRPSTVGTRSGIGKATRVTFM